MYAIISELEEDAAVQVMHLWRQLNEACGLQGIFNFPTPHFTWFAAEYLAIKKVVPALQAIIADTEPLQIRTSGLGMFSGDNPVLYLPIVKSMELSELHKEIWDQTQPYSDDAKPYYSPQLWVPHITLALMDLTQENLACAIDSIAFESLELFLQVDNLAVVEQDGMEIGETLHQFKFE